MSKYIPKRTHENERQWLGETHGRCCLYGLTAYSDGDLFVYSLYTENRHCLESWRIRLRSIWSLLRGRPLYLDSLEFYDAASFDEFLQDAIEASEFAFGVRKEKAV